MLHNEATFPCITHVLTSLGEDFGYLDAMVVLD